MSTRRVLFVELPLAAIAYAVLTALVTWPVAKHISSTVLGPMDSDSAGGIWWLDAIQTKGYRVTGSTVFDNVAYPFGLEQANGLNIQWLIPNFPAFLATKVVGEVAAFNLIVFTGFIFSGMAMYALARRLGVSIVAAGWAGAAFILFPWHVERAVAGHATLIHLWCFPLVALSLLHLRERWTRSRLALVGLAVIACWLTSGYFGVMALATVPVAALAGALVSATPRRAVLAATAITLVTVVASGAVVVATIPGGADGNVGSTRELGDLSVYGLRPLELIVPSPGSTLMKRIAPGFDENRRHGSNIQEVSNYIGWVTILFAVTWMVVAIRRSVGLSPALRAVTAASAATAGVALLFSLPNPILVAGKLFDYMPSRLLWTFVPAFRVPSRWSIEVCFAILIVATLGLDAVLAKLSRNGRNSLNRRALTAAGISIVFVATLVELRVQHPGVYYSATDPPPVYSLLERAPPGPLAEYPFVASENSTNSAYLLWQRIHRRPLLNGAAMGSEAEEVRRALVDPTAAGTAERLAALGATTVITRPDTFSRALDEGSPDVPPHLGVGYRRIGTTIDGASVWAVTAAPAPAVAYLGSPQFTVPQRSHGRVTQSLVGPAGTIVVTSDRRFSGTLRLHATSLGAPRRRVIFAGTPVDVTNKGVDVTIPIELHSPRSLFRVRVLGLSDGEVGLSVSAPTVRS